MIRKAEKIDSKNIIELEKRYYDGYSISEDLLSKWISNGNFYICEEDSKIIGSIYFEFIDKIKDLPWHHEPIIGNGKYAYISEIAVNSENVVPALFQKVMDTAKQKNCEAIIWLTGVKSNHDKIEQGFLKSSGFEKFKDVKDWECAPNYFIDDHSLWVKKL